MLNIVPSTADKPNPQFVQTKRAKDSEDNAAWLERNLKTLEKEADADGAAYLVLFGGQFGADFQLRVAQSHVRFDMSPSHWSHVGLLKGSSHSTRTLWEISLEPKDGFGFPPSDNGVQNGHIKTYASTNKYPNVAVLRLPVKRTAMAAVLQRFKRQRNEIDCVELALLWLAHIWGVGRSLNPLLDGYGTPSAAFVEALTTACGFDLTPGLESRASCPEAIWQAARWWHDFHASQDGSAAIRGMWHTEHFLG